MNLEYDKDLVHDLSYDLKDKWDTIKQNFPSSRITFSDFTKILAMGWQMKYEEDMSNYDSRCEYD